MVYKYYLRPDSNTPPNYSYKESDDTDVLWNAETCIEVPKQPSCNHVYNITSKAWELSEEYYMTDLRAKRDAELIRTDKYVLSDYPISAEDKTIVETYRTALRNCPDAELIADRILPECPDICKN